MKMKADNICRKEMKKVGIVTLCGFGNYGNRLQNYAVQEILKRRNLYVDTIMNVKANREIDYLKIRLKTSIKRFFPFKLSFKRYRNFLKFNKNISFTSYTVRKNHIPPNLAEQYDYFIVGSDQVWNPIFKRISEFDFLNFAPSYKKHALSASFGVSELPENYKEIVERNLKEFKNISVREERGKEIIKEITKRDDVEVLLDPTMILKAEEWRKIEKKPRMLKSSKYILTYFLDTLKDDDKKAIEEFARANNYEVINLRDGKSPFFECGPREFLYLERNASLICTDSFHSSVFAILFKVPFMVFSIQGVRETMKSRLDTLLKKFSLENRRYDGKLKKEDLKINYSKVGKVLTEERKKFEKFLDKIFEE